MSCATRAEAKTVPGRCHRCNSSPVEVPPPSPSTMHTRRYRHACRCAPSCAPTWTPSTPCAPAAGPRALCLAPRPAFPSAAGSTCGSRSSSTTTPAVRAPSPPLPFLACMRARPRAPWHSPNARSAEGRTRTRLTELPACPAEAPPTHTHHHYHHHQQQPTHPPTHAPGERLPLFQAVIPVLRFDIPTALFVMPYLVQARGRE